MATAGGPDIERDGLIFGYDTGYGIGVVPYRTLKYTIEPYPQTKYNKTSKHTKIDLIYNVFRTKHRKRWISIGFRWC